MGSNFHPFTQPYLQALQVKAAHEDLLARQEDRQRRAQAFQMEMEDRERQRQQEDFHTQIAMRSLGMHPVQQGIAGKVAAGLGGRDVMNFRGQQYSMRSPEQQGQFETQQAVGRATQIKDAEDPFVEVPLGPKFGGKTVRIRQSHASTLLSKGVTNLHPTTSTDDAGNVTTIWSDPTTGQEVTRSVAKSAGKTKATPEGSIEHEIKATVDATDDPQRERRIQEMMPWAFSQLRVDPKDALPQDAEKARKLAENNVDEAIKLEYKRKLAAETLKRKGGKKAASSGTGEGGLKPGQTGTFNGKRIRVKAVSGGHITDYEEIP